MAARLIEATEEMGFPRFSGDGRYIEVQYVDEMERVLGSRQDDSLNSFTARMLLLLESQPLHDDAIYGSLLQRIIRFYYRDFEDHADDFFRSFLINDSYASGGRLPSTTSAIASNCSTSQARSRSARRPTARSRTTS